MENVFVRHRNVTVLVALLFGQILGLAMQVKRNEPGEGQGKTPLLRVWVMGAITPVEKLVVRGTGGVRDTWDDYLNLRGVRKENADLKAQLDQMRLDQVRLQEDAAQARRLQALLHFKEQYLAQTVAAQVVGSSGTEQSRVIYIDKGESDGLRQDMPVITPDGVVGKIVRVMPSTSQVLLITDPSWGIGGILEKSRLQGIARGTSAGDVKLTNILSDERVEPGERVLTSGGDRIFPKGLPLGTVSELPPREDLFLNIRLKPAVNLSRLEEVLVITKIDERAPTLAESEQNGPVRASDILSERLPNVPKNQQPVVTKPVESEPDAGNENEPAQERQQAKPAESATKPANGEMKPSGNGANHTGTAAPNANHSGQNHVTTPGASGTTPAATAPTGTKPNGTHPNGTQMQPDHTANPQQQQPPPPKPAEEQPPEPPAGDNPR